MVYYQTVALLVFRYLKQIQNRANLNPWQDNFSFTGLQIQELAGENDVLEVSLPLAS